MRCGAAEPRESRSWKVGGVSIRRSGRELELSGLPDRIRIAAFSAPPEGISWDTFGLRGAREVSFGVLLGGLGASERHAEEGVRALNALSWPTLVLAGGSDLFEVLDATLERPSKRGAARVIDVTRMTRVVAGRHVFVPLSGAPDGRYARGKRACGYSSEDLERTESAQPSKEEKRRWLLSWAAPRGPSGEGFAGVPAGASKLRDLARRIGARGGLSAWPQTQTGKMLDAEGGASEKKLHRPWFIVPPLAGPSVEQADGTRVIARAVTLELSSNGMREVPSSRNFVGSPESAPR